jgi:hypothetical protein
MRRLWLLPLVLLAVGCVPDEPAAPKDDIAPLVAQLGDRDFRTREKATRDLTAKGWDAVPAVQKALDKATEPEVAERLEKVLAAITKLEWYAKPDEAVAAASKSGRPILMFSTIGDPDGFA